MDINCQWKGTVCKKNKNLQGFSSFAEKAMEDKGKPCRLGFSKNRKAIRSQSGCLKKEGVCPQLDL